MGIGGIHAVGGPLRARRALLAGGLAVMLFGVGALGVLHTPRAAPPPAPPRGVNSSLQDNPVIESGSLARAIQDLQTRVRAVPADWTAWASLGLAYVQQARISGDPSYYPKAEGVLERSLEVKGEDNFDAMVGMASLAAARHDFAGALEWGRKAELADPYNGNVHDVTGDALIELGRYPEAFEEIQRAVDIKPDISSYARASYAHELQGDVQGAVGIMRLALAAAGTSQDRAWTLGQLGDLFFNSGDLARATENYRKATGIDPTFVPARAGLAKVEAAAGETNSAIADYTWVVDRLPLPEYVIALGDLYALARDPASADRQYGLLHVEESLFRSNGVNIDLEVALFDADHRVDLAGGLAAARAEWARRRSVNVADALAWELLANGKAKEALYLADRALSLGTRNALFFFHRGMIDKALGRTAAARRDLAMAIAINSHFSVLWSDTAASTLAALGGAP